MTLVDCRDHREDLPQVKDVSSGRSVDRNRMNISFRSFLEVTGAYDSFGADDIPAHIETVASVLERVSAGELSRVILLAPQQHHMTRVVTHFLAYLKETNLTAAVADHLSSGRPFDSRRPPIRFATCDQKVAEFAAGIACRLVSEGEQKIMASTTGSYSSGIGFSAAVVHAPYRNMGEAHDPKCRRRINDWFDNEVLTSMHPVGGPIVVSDCRWHKDDLVGHLLTNHADENWHVVYLPAICPAFRPCYLDEVSVEPESRVPGEALFPGGYDLAKLEAIRQGMSSGRWNALWQQDPRRWNGE